MSLPKMSTIDGWRPRGGRWYRRISGIIHRIRQKDVYSASIGDGTTMHGVLGATDLHVNCVVEQLIAGEWKLIHSKKASEAYSITSDDVLDCVQFAEFLGELL